ncbi:hypothetical protein [Blastomonas aquatica]|uniref:NACHT domain-containing protein n=1 Tax=Blastomonas aquatica TaxID=1510276 RepID=A0ABQ1JWC8_9SPHN|nr:hypothetical protein [Blastomonas aquatica]GGB76140.1 hypothetical protein GCM10010833_34200 [Blastomonas aquatica]
MDKSIKNELSSIRAALTALKHSGHDGFEGLLASIFSSITNHTFRLAGSGSQHGKDGSGAVSTGSIAFEAKLYNGAINKNEVLSKLTEIVASHPMPDLWVLGATIEIKTQIADPLARAAQKMGVNLLLLDWSPSSTIPELALLCALAKDATVAFLEDKLQDKTQAKLAEAALTKIRDNPNFEHGSQQILAFLRNPALGQSVAQEANSQWLRAAFADPRQARQQFGQQVSPLANNPLPVVPRDALSARIGTCVFSSIEDEVVVLIGGEGRGKTWLFAQSWTEQDTPPITLVIPAAEFPKGLVNTNEREFLVHQIVKQTSGILSEHTLQRWRNVFEQWSAETHGTKPNLVVFIDGLNQYPDYRWADRLDGMAKELSDLGGRLVVSVRNGYFDSRLRSALLTKQKLIPIPEWSEAELKSILQQNGVPQSNLRPRVIKTLRNPRVLGIAFNLKASGSIQDFDELSIDRLLFEHIRKSSRDQTTSEDPLVFKKRLSAHARHVLERVSSEQSNDTRVFESADLGSGNTFALTQNLLAVSEGRFFHSLPDDPYFYELTDDGLIVALGFAILDAVSSSLRSKTPANETLDAMLEPINALDLTAEAVHAALVISSIDERAEDNTVSALISAYLRLQNIDENAYPAFEAVVRSRTNAAMEALRDLAVSSFHVSNEDWLTHALRELRGDANAWSAMSAHIHNWLKCYSLDPKIGVFEDRSKGEEAYQAKVEERKQLLSTRLDHLSDDERAFFTTQMTRDDALASSEIAAKIFRLLAGMALGDFTESLVAWAFGQAINSDLHRPYDEYMYLVRFNSIDWARTREALLQHAAPLSKKDTSKAGKWAYVHVLRATSTLEDGQICRKLIEELTKDRERFEGWRLIEKYCATDPCDPNSERPDNIDQTAKKYRAIDLDNLRTSLGSTAEDHFLQDASFGLARFDPETAIEVHRSVIEKFSASATNATKHRLLGLRDATALVTGTARESLLNLARQKSRPYRDDKDSRDDWILAQYGLLMIFPHLDGDEQLEALLSLNSYGPPLLDLADVLKEATPLALERALDRCVQSDNPDFKMTILMVARYSATELTERSVGSLRKLANDDKSSVRSIAIGALVDLDDDEFIQSFANSQWDANALNTRECHFERWDGARAIARAHRYGFLSEQSAVSRVSREHYHLLALEADDADLSEIPNRLNASVAKMLEVDLPLVAPTIAQSNGDQRRAFHTPLRSVEEPQKELSLEDFPKRLSETEDEFDARQERGRKAFESFEDTLSRNDARQIIDDTASATLRACARSNLNLLEEWATVFLENSGRKIRHIYNFGLRVAEVLSHNNPELAARLFDHLRGNRGFVNIVQGPAALGLESLSTWGAADHSAINKLREIRLDEAATDHEIAQEVLAALSAGKSTVLDAYVDKRLNCEEPVNVARALMVCGFAHADGEREAIIANYEGLPGIVGKAAETARYAYDRNLWALHWHDLMQGAQSNEDFWRFSVLFLKVVDGRYQTWERSKEPYSEPMGSFAPSIWREIERRIERWKKKRSDKLFGEKAPANFFLVGG